MVVQTFGILHFGCCKIGFHFEWQNDEFRLRPFGPSRLFLVLLLLHRTRGRLADIAIVKLLLNLIILSL